MTTTPTETTAPTTSGTATTSSTPAGARGARTAAVGLLAGALVLAPALAASAHVRVAVEDPTAGGYSLLTFRVPNESDTAGTTVVAVDLPTGTPLTSVSVEPVPGWTAEVVRGELPEPVETAGGEVTEAPLSVTWTADDGVQIAPGELQRFVVSAGPLPEAGTDVVLPATQTYSDGEVVAWDQPVVEGEEEPATPAPAFTTVAAEEEPATELTAATTADDGAPAPADGAARWLAGGALVVAAGAFLLALAGLGRRRAPR